MIETAKTYQDAARVFTSARRALQDKLQNLGYEDVTPDRAMILLAVAEREQPLSRLEGSAYCGTNISYNVNKLTETGYAELVTAPHDRRYRILRVTDKGATLVHALTKAPSTAADEVTHVA